MSEMTERAGARTAGSDGRRRLRALIFRLHTWLGLHVCLLFSIIFLTGSIIVLSAELYIGPRPDLYIAPPGAEEPRASLGEIYDAVREEVPEAAVIIISGPPRPWFGMPVTLYIPDVGTKRLWMHPTEATAIGMQDVGRMDYASFFRTLHDSLLVPLWPAQAAVTGLSLVLLTMVVTGLVTYRRFWKGFFRWPARGMDARMRNGVLHRTIGVWVMPFLLIMALTSVVYFAKAVGIDPDLGSPPPIAPREVRLPDGFDGEDVDRLAAIAQAAVPTLEPKGIVLPGTGKEAITISGGNSAEPPFMRYSGVVIDPATEEVIFVRRASEGNLMAKLMPIANAIHYGEFGGFVTLVLWFVLGLASSYLLLTGARIFALRTLRERQVTGGAAAAAPQGTLRIVWQGLGIFRWAYVLMVLVMAASLARTLL